jgi:hypothetical protein
MSNLTSVGITNGIPTSGTGTVSTLDAVMALLPAALGAGGGLKIDGSGTALPVSGTVAVSSAVLGAGSAIVGKVGIDQTTPGTTNGVQVNAALPAGSNVIGGVTNVPLTNALAGLYETVAASQTAQVLGGTGAIGDFISGLLVIPATTSPGNVLLLDNATSITVFTGGATSVSNLVPFFIPLGMYSVSGAWKVTTGGSVSVIGIGKFT